MAVWKLPFNFVKPKLDLEDDFNLGHSFQFRSEFVDSGQKLDLNLTL